jgi:hypothetical protein
LINSTVSHVVSELNDYLKLRTRSPLVERVVAGSLFDLDGNINAATKEVVVATLVGVEQDSVYRSVDVFERNDDGTARVVNPQVNINCYLLFAANLGDYVEAIKQLSYVVAFFQHRPTFRSVDVRGEESRVTAELHSLSFEQQNHLWGSLGAKYLPSVLYKLGIIAIRDEEPVAEIRPVEEVLIE